MPWVAAAVRIAWSVACGNGPSPFETGVARTAAATTALPRSVSSPSRSSSPSADTRTSEIEFSVRVPVLSKHIWSTRPNASRARGLRTSALLSASRRAAATCDSVASAGSPSGTAATIRETPVPTASRTGCPRSSPSPVTAAPPTSDTGIVMLVRRLSRCSTPDGGGADAVDALRPVSVSTPTATTSAVTDPAAIDEPSKSIDV